LQAGDDPPLHFELLLDAQMNLARNDTRRAIIDAAVAAETYIRATVLGALPPGVGPETQSILDEANLRPILTKAFPEAEQRLGRQARPKDVISRIHKLLDARNKVVHKGLMRDEYVRDCAKYLEAVSELVAIG
jgi:hypothetical protein